MKRVLLTSALVLILISTFASAFYKYIVKKDYESFFHITCEEGELSCFIPSVCSEGESLCEPYKVLVVKPVDLQGCSSDEGQCLQNFCEAQPERCEIILCSEESKNYFGVDDECSL